MIDWSRVSELRDEIGAEDFSDVVDLFLEEVAEVITRLQTAPDLQALEGDLHFLKGSALNLGFADFADLCQTGETQSSAGSPDQVDLTGILCAFDASREAFISGLNTRFAA